VLVTGLGPGIYNGYLATSGCNSHIHLDKTFIFTTY